MNCNIFTIPSIDSKKDIETGHIKDEDTEQRPLSQTGNLRTTLLICIGARVMVTINTDVSDGLVNGATGTVAAFVEGQQEVSTILVKFDNTNVGSRCRASNPFQQQYPGSTPIKRQQAMFSVGGR